MHFNLDKYAKVRYNAVTIGGTVTKLCSFTLDEKTIEKLNWVIANTVQKSKSALIDRLIELEFIRIKTLKDQSI